MPDYTPEEANGGCGGCEYHLTEMDGTQTQNIGDSDIIKSDQTCGRILKRKSDGNFTSEGCEECDSKSEPACTEHCEWKENINKCVLGTIGGDCSLIGCHQKCQYPFRSEVAYTPEGNVLLQSEPGFGEPMITINDKLDQVSRLSVPTIYSKTDKYYNNVREIFNEGSTSSTPPPSTDFTQEVYGGIASGENCGALKNSGTTNHHIKFPDPPDFEDFLEIVKNKSNLQGEINWFALNPISYDLVTTSPFGVVIPDQPYLTTNHITIPLSNNGISLQWWKDDETGDLVPEDDPQLIQIGDTASIITKTFGTIQNNPLYNYLQSNPIHNYDFSRICQQQLRDADISSVLAPTGEDNFIFSFLLNVGPDAEQNRSFERCMNRLMRTPGDNDKEMVSNIKEEIHSLSDLGEDTNEKKRILDYVERKIKKFLSLRTDQFDKCIEKIEISDNICANGLFPNAMDMLSRILHMETGRVGNSDTELEESKIKVVSDRLLKYVPQLLKKILEISTTYENDYCGAVSPKTQLLQEIYDNLFKKEVTINIPDLGMGGFFEDFGDYGIIGKVVLLLFFVYILTQVVALFKVNVAV